ncbi:MAG TPA: CsgG/HfaB family protein [Syntrophales bacterium]|nr:CsgG/HfaB family protein [Syntrophales bacterium]HQQ25888.1 CsgG/HfaB family protein [Syntrophales bacterium]
MNDRWFKGIGLFLIFVMFCPAFAGDRKVVAVLPFAVHSGENIDYVKKGVWDMLYSRLSAGGELELVSRQAVQEALAKLNKPDLRQEDVLRIGGALGADYVVWGSITKFGNSLSLDGKLMDVAGGGSPVGVFEQCKSLDEVIPRIGDFAGKIQMHALGRIPETALPRQESPAPAPWQPASAPSGEKGSGAAQALKTPEGTFTSIINPDLINAPEPIDRKGFWMTQRYSYEFRGMDIGDVNGDGLNETVVISPTIVHVFVRQDKALIPVKRIDGGKYDSYLTVDIADINENGIPEIIITNIVGGVLRSFVIEYRDGEFRTIASELPYFLRVVHTLGRPVLIGQVKGLENPFDYPIHEIIWQGGTYERGKRMPIPEGLPVYGLAMDSIDGSDRPKLVLLDDYDRIRIYTPSMKRMDDLNILGGSDELIWKSDDYYGGSNNAFNRALTTSQRDSGQTMEEESDTTDYVKLRILTYDLNGNGKNDVIIVKNVSPAGRVFKNLQLFTASEIYDLEWDGLGLSENWKTKKIQGYVADYQVKDIDNDGENEIVLALVVSFSGSLRQKSVLVAYDFTIQAITP